VQQQPRIAAATAARTSIDPARSGIESKLRTGKYKLRCEQWRFHILSQVSALVIAAQIVLCARWGTFFVFSLFVVLFTHMNMNMCCER
jgi:hypothetical protein